MHAWLRSALARLHRLLSSAQADYKVIYNHHNQESNYIIGNLNMYAWFSHLRNVRVTHYIFFLIIK